jgi:hypothetical protein
MTPTQRKVVLGLLVAVSILGAVVLIYVGHALFQNRAVVFWVFSGYTVLLTGIVIFFGFRLIGFR